MGSNGKIFWKSHKKDVLKSSKEKLYDATQQPQHLNNFFLRNQKSKKGSVLPNLPPNKQFNSSPVP